MHIVSAKVEKWMQLNVDAHANADDEFIKITKDFANEIERLFQRIPVEPLYFLFPTCVSIFRDKTREFKMKVNPIEFVVCISLLGEFWKYRDLVGDLIRDLYDSGMDRTFETICLYANSYYSGAEIPFDKFVNID